MTGRAGMGRVLRDGLVVLGVALLTYQGLRRWVSDRYVVPSDSMQPLLFGSQESGDVVLVDKLASARDLDRYDTLVARHPEDPNARLVKRVVAFGDELERCWVELRDGDLWLGPDAQRLNRAVKDPLASRDLRATWFAWPAKDAAVAERLLVVPTTQEPVEPDQAADAAVRPLWLLPTTGPEATRRSMQRSVRQERHDQGLEVFEPGWISTRRAVDGSYRDAYGSRGREGEATEVTDVGMDFFVVSEPVLGLYCGLDLRPDAWMFHWQPAGNKVALWCNGQVLAEHDLPADLLRRGREPGEAVRVEYGLLDGRLFFAVGSQPDGLWCVERKPEWGGVDPGSAPWQPMRTRLYIGADAKEPVPVERLVVFRDVYWFRLPQLGMDPGRKAVATLVPPGHLYLLGDNSFDSLDSRMFGPVPAANLTGRPRAVIGPYPRFQWLSR